MNTEPLDYAGRKGLQEFQQKSAETSRQPEAEQQKQDENPLTRAEVQGLVNSLVESIVKNFAQKGDIDRIARSFEIAKQEFKRSVPTKKQITDWAKEEVPPSLRGLDSDPTRKLGDTLKLISGYPVGSDKAAWMPDSPVGKATDWSKFSLGFTITGTTVTILTGTIDRITVAQADVTVADNDYVYVRRTIADDTMLVVAGASVPADDATYKYYRLYQFTVTGDDSDPVVYTATLKFALRPFDIEAGGGGGGLTVEGDQVLYKGVFLREYDEEGVIVEVGEEIGTEGTGHTLKPTWDLTRAHS